MASKEFLESRGFFSLLTRKSEKKFPFHPFYTDFILDFLHHICIPHSEFPENKIFTIYYDTLDLRSYYENVNGDSLKSKLRIRWYGQKNILSDSSIDAFVEVKVKKGFSVEKVRKQVRLRRPQVEEMSLFDRLWEDVLFPVLAEIGWSRNERLFPVMLITYIRSRFLDPFAGSHIALDRNIVVEKVNKELLPSARPVRINTAVLEIKGGDISRPIAGMLRKLSMRWDSFSKYVVGMDSCRRINEVL